MKRVVAIVRLEKLSEVQKSLRKEHFLGMTVTPASGAGAEEGVTLQFRGRSFQESFTPKVKFEIVAPDIDIPKITETISSAAKTGRAGDGKIFVEPIEEVIRIRDGERGESVVAPGRLVEIARQVELAEAEELQYETA